MSRTPEQIRAQAIAEGKQAAQVEQTARETAREAFNAALRAGAPLRAARRSGDRAYRKAGGAG